MLLSQKQLAEAMGFEPNQMSRIEKCLIKQGIKVFYGQKCIWTTTECISQAAKADVLSEIEVITIDD